MFRILWSTAGDRRWPVTIDHTPSANGTRCEAAAKTYYLSIKRTLQAGPAGGRRGERMSDDRDDKTRLPVRQSSAAEVEAFLADLAATPRAGAAGGRGRLLFALDATASRQPTWDRAAHLQAEMFQEAAALGGLEIQFCFYRGFGEFRASPWLARSEPLLRMMTSVFCLAGKTQIGKVLQHAINEARRRPLAALVFVGDCFEEDVDRIGALAGELGLLGVRAFVFHEGGDPLAAFAFQQIARLSGGAYCRFDAGSAQALRDLLRAVAAFAAGGLPALENLANRSGGPVRRIAHQLRER
jgi:hypothetical protein